MAVRLISFVGTGNYSEVTYQSAEKSDFKTRYVAQALATWFEPAEIVLLATPEAWKAHGEGLSAALSRWHWCARTILSGGAAKEQFDQFDELRSALSPAPGLEVVLDITHGWRAQPFLAAAGVAFQRATVPDAPPVRVVYGAFSGADTAPVWELPAFMDLVSWGQGLRMFLETGRAREVVEAMEPLGTKLQAARARGGPPELRGLAKAINKFSEDLHTLRTGELVGGSGSAAGLVAAVQSARPAVEAHLRPLAPHLNRIVAMAEPLTITELDAENGDTLLTSLASLYLDLDRIMEAMTVVREAHISRAAAQPDRRPGTPGKAAQSGWRQRRDHAETVAGRSSDWRTIADVRNNLDHAGFQSQPLPAKTVRAQVAEWVAKLGSPSAVAAGAGASTAGVFVNLSNHPSAAWTAGQKAAALALAPTILDVPFPEVPPEDEELLTSVPGVLEKVPAGARFAMVHGEPVLSMLLVSALQRRGVSCVAATTAREVTVADGGEKTSRFRFVRFREYPKIG